MGAKTLVRPGLAVFVMDQKENDLVDDDRAAVEGEQRENVDWER